MQLPDGVDLHLDATLVTFDSMFSSQEHRSDVAVDPTGTDFRSGLMDPDEAKKQ